jgi:hypothetical protein
VLGTDNARTSTAGVTLPATAGTFNAATFTVGGETGYTYAITLPAASFDLADGGGTNAMAVTDVVSAPANTGTLTAGSEVISVGATLNVGAAQVAGTYTNTTDLAVTVNYN